MISRVLFASEHRAARETLKFEHFLLIVTDIVVFEAIYSTCMVYTETVIHLGFGEWWSIFTSSSVNIIVNYCLISTG